MTYAQRIVLPLFLSITADPLGRPDFATLTDQARLELLFDGLHDADKRQVQDDDGFFLEVCEWPSIQCDEQQNVTAVSVGDFAHIGTLNLSFMPPHMHKFEVSNRVQSAGEKLRGTLEASELSQVLHTLHIERQAFNGTVDIPRLPRGLIQLNLTSNCFTGSCDLRSLPPGLINCYLRDNLFSGIVQLDSLPSTLLTLDIARCAFSGQLSFVGLSENLNELVLSNNAFCGDFVLVGRGCRLRVNAERTSFSGTAVLQKKGNIHVSLEESNVTAVVDEFGEKHERMDQVLLGIWIDSS